VRCGGGTHIATIVGVDGPRMDGPSLSVMCATQQGRIDHHYLWNISSHIFNPHPSVVVVALR
jgi:hypothetical protein